MIQVPTVSMTIKEENDKSNEASTQDKENLKQSKDELR